MADASSIVILGPSGETYELRSTRALEGPPGWVITDGRLAASLLRAHLLTMGPRASVVARMLRELVGAWTPTEELDDEAVVEGLAESFTDHQSFKELLLDVAGSPAFGYRRQEEVSP